MSRDNAETIRLFYEADPDGDDILQYLPILYTFRNGLIVRIDGFVDKDEAREAAGLDL